MIDRRVAPDRIKGALIGGLEKPDRAPPHGLDEIAGGGVGMTRLRQSCLHLK
jgi:hypothetical protein